MAIIVELIFAFTSVVLTVLAFKSAGVAWRLQHQPIDFAIRVLASLWLVYLLASTALPLVRAGEQHFWLLAARFVGDMTHQCLLVGVGLFLLVAAATARPWILGVLVLQTVGGLGTLSWVEWSDSPSPIVRDVMLALNLLGGAIVTGCVVAQVLRTQSRRSWLASAACMMAIGLLLNHAVAAQSLYFLHPPGYYLYAFILLGTWKLISSSADADQAFSRPASALSGFAQSTHFTHQASVSADADFMALAVRAERERIAHELHDNLGSQLTAILYAVQASTQPQKQFVLMSLEQCLTDLKMMVDAIDSYDENLPYALGQLRYRLQHVLDRQRITMLWEVEASSELDAVQGVFARQVLRIAQESLANVMRHSKAGVVKVVCRFVPDLCCLLLEVRDDGLGMVHDKNNPPLGRGLPGMRRRAAAVGGLLVIASVVGGGTLVRLTLPLPHLNPGAAVPRTKLVVTEATAH